ncbi:MAG TPA: hypothetical protein VLS94_09710 [Fusibacter sp.]|nr:hypothetical protein [Fusibacter sp.]
MSEIAQTGKTPVVSKDGKTQILLPAGWADVRKPDTPDHLSIKVADRRRDLHLNVGTKPRIPSITIAQLTEMTATGLKGMMQNGKSERTALKTVNSYAGVQYKLQGILLGIDTTMLITLVETPKYYHVITAGSTTQSFGQYQPELQQMIQSFKELNKTASAK